MFLVKLGQVIIESLGRLLDASADMAALTDPVSLGHVTRSQDTYHVIVYPYVNHDKVFLSEFRIPDEIRNLSALQVAHG